MGLGGCHPTLERVYTYIYIYYIIYVILNMNMNKACNISVVPTVKACQSCESKCACDLPASSVVSCTDRKDAKFTKTDVLGCFCTAWKSSQALWPPIAWHGKSAARLWGPNLLCSGVDRHQNLRGFTMFHIVSLWVQLPFAWHQRDLTLKQLEH